MGDYIANRKWLSRLVGEGAGAMTVEKGCGLRYDADSRNRGANRFLLGAYRRPLRVQTISAVSRPAIDRIFISRRIISWILLSSFVWKARTLSGLSRLKPRVASPGNQPFHHPLEN
jgi:hypothetical protein